MTLLVDMNLSAGWVSFLEHAGLGATHWSTLGAANAPDDEIMAYAKARGWIVLTNDLDFSSMLARSGASQPSVVQLRSPDLRIEAMGALVVEALRKLETSKDLGVILTVTEKQTRLRLLPLPSRLK